MNGGNNGDPPGDGDDDDVGYGKPPRRTRFRPGKSGNPKGRPKRSFGKHHLPDAILQRAREIFIEEGDRAMTIREGGQLAILTAYEASVRAAHIAAAKGSAMAQRTVIQERLRIESEIAEIMRGAFDQALKYKQECAIERLRCHKAGLPEPWFPVNPDYILLDWQSFTVHYEGPLAEQLKGSLQERIRCRDEWIEDFQLCRDRWQESPGRASLVMTLQAQRYYDIINESLPPRFRKALRGRLAAKDIDVTYERTKSNEEKTHPGAPDDP